jgi:hypothetical protein
LTARLQYDRTCDRDNCRSRQSSRRDSFNESVTVIVVRLQRFNHGCTYVPSDLVLRNRHLTIWAMRMAQPH